jgi:hypothetical protein
MQALPETQAHRAENRRLTNIELQNIKGKPGTSDRFNHCHDYRIRPFPVNIHGFAWML